jgi:hypothetical protein
LTSAYMIVMSVNRQASGTLAQPSGLNDNSFNISWVVVVSMVRAHTHKEILPK